MDSGGSGVSSALTVRQARLVLPDRVVTGDLVVEDGVITEIAPRVDRAVGEQIDGRDRVLLPGLIDLSVELDTIEDLSGVSTAALAGGVTTVLGVAPAVTAAELKVELARALEASKVHAGLYVRATGDNLDELGHCDRARGIWVSGALLHDARADALFAAAGRPLVVDNTDPDRIAARAQLYPDAADPSDHSRIHDIDSAVAATRRALELAQRHGRATVLSHASAAEELDLLRDRAPCVTACVRPANLFLDDTDYARLGTRAVAVPPVRSPRHRTALWDGLVGGGIDVVCSGHHQVRAEWKDQAYPGTPTGVPAVQWTLPMLLDAAAAGRCTWSDIARWTAEVPAKALRLPRKGRLETGYDGDLVLVDPAAERVVGGPSAAIVGGWSPWQGAALRGWPVLTVVLGVVGCRDGEIALGTRGRTL